MVGSVLTLALIGLGAVSNALPTADTVKERQVFGFGPGGSSFGTGSGEGTQCITGVPLNEQPPCILTVVGGSVNPPKDRRFVLPPDANTNRNHAIDTLEHQLEALQNKKRKTREDYSEIEDIKAALNYLGGITSISAPPGTGSTFHPGKRSELGAYANECPSLEGAELALERLIQKDHLSFQETLISERLKSFLLACGVTIVKSPDGTSTIIKPSDKRDVYTPGFDIAGLEKAYDVLTQSVGTSKPSFTTWLVIQHMESLLKLYGITIENSPTGTTTTFRPGKRQTFTIGKQTCDLADIYGLKATLATLYATYGPPQNAPQNIFLIEQVIVSYLTLCGQTVNGWTTLTPGNPIPGGPITPDPTTPGAPINPDPTNPGAPIKPDPTTPGAPLKPDPTTTGAPIKPDPTNTAAPITPSDKRQAPISDPSALLAALQLLESKYGGYGSGTIPVPVFLIMESIVTILQDIPGVTVPGWPLLGAGSTSGIHPSG